MVNAPDGDHLAVAVRCLEQARAAQATVREHADDIPGYEHLSAYISAAQHVYSACCRLNQDWPAAIPRTARNAANRYVKQWDASDGATVRNVIEHYEEVLGDANHRHRGVPTMYRRVRGVDTPFPDDGFMWGSDTGPETIRLLWKDYKLRGVWHALEALSRELERVLVDANDPRYLRRE